jgi:hypothetical protein
MTDSPSPPSFSHRLIEQDRPLHSPQYQGHRMQLELKLTQARFRERLTFRIVVAALLTALVLLPVCGMRLFGSPDPGDRTANWLSVSLGAIQVLATITFWVGLASYYSRFRPAVRQLSEDVRDETIRELRDEVRTLQQQVAKFAKSDDR